MVLVVKMYFVQCILEMEEFVIIKMVQMACDLAVEGYEVISFSFGEFDFDILDYIKKVVKKVFDDGYIKYMLVFGLVELCKVIQMKFKCDNGLEFELSQIVVFNGVKQFIVNICMFLFDEGDEVVILVFYWVFYFEIVKVVGGVFVLVSVGIEQDYKVIVDQVWNVFIECI